MKKLWKRWLKVAQFIGNVQMIVLLSVVYWLMVTFLALPMKLFSDPLKMRKPGRSNWVERDKYVPAREFLQRPG